MGITKEQLLPKLLDAIEHPVAPQMVQKPLAKKSSKQAQTWT